VRGKQPEEISQAVREQIEKLTGCVQQSDEHRAGNSLTTPLIAEL